MKNLNMIGYNKNLHQAVINSPDGGFFLLNLLKLNTQGFDTTLRYPLLLRN